MPYWTFWMKIFSAAKSFTWHFGLSGYWLVYSAKGPLDTLYAIMGGRGEGYGFMILQFSFILTAVSNYMASFNWVRRVKIGFLIRTNIFYIYLDKYMQQLKTCMVIIIICYEFYIMVMMYATKQNFQYCMFKLSFCCECVRKTGTGINILIWSSMFWRHILV